MKGRRWFGIDPDKTALAGFLMARADAELEPTELVVILDLLNTEMDVRADHDDMPALEALYAKLRGEDQE